MDQDVHTRFLCFTIKFKVTEREPPEDVKEVFQKYSGDDGLMKAEHLQRFLKEVQREEHASIDDVEQIIKRVQEEAAKPNEALTLHEFHHYLFSTVLNPPIASEVNEDRLKDPLTHYFIFTGHNSYLKGNQLTSRSCVEPIIQSLKRGVRVVELDLWPNKNNGIKVVHGRTMTKPVPLIECLKAIEKHAFEASKYPVILTLEDHLTSQLQQKVAQMLHDTFGEKLYVPESELQECPSPEKLKGRILVSTKTPKEYYEEIEYVEKENNNLQQDVEEDDDDPDDEDPDEDDIDQDGKQPLKYYKSPLKKRNKKARRIRWNRQENRESIRQRILSAIFPHLRAKYHITAHKYKIDGDEASEHEEGLAYRELIAIHAGKLKGELKEAFIGEHQLDKVRRVSLTEQSLEKAIDSHGHRITRFAQKNFLRVYPKGTRFNSSNYNPFLGWMHGAQMVAFNMQGHGRHLWVMNGMFRGNGGCGYVKKPDILLNATSDNQVFDPKVNDLPVKNTLKVKVYTTDGWRSDFKLTHFDAHSPPDFYVRVGIAGVPADKKMKRTEEKMNDWTPVWNKELSFPLMVPELALLRIEVHEYDPIGDDFAGQTCLPVLELKSGIRAVPLYCRKGRPYKSVRLLMRFNLE